MEITTYTPYCQEFQLLTGFPQVFQKAQSRNSDRLGLPLAGYLQLDCSIRPIMLSAIVGSDLDLWGNMTTNKPPQPPRAPGISRKPPDQDAQAEPEPKLIGTAPCEYPDCGETANVYDHGDGKYVATHKQKRVGLPDHDASYGSYFLPKVTLK